MHLILPYGSVPHSQRPPSIPGWYLVEMWKMLRVDPPPTSKPHGAVTLGWVRGDGRPSRCGSMTPRMRPFVTAARRSVYRLLTADPWSDVVPAQEYWQPCSTLQMHDRPASWDLIRADVAATPPASRPCRRSPDGQQIRGSRLQTRSINQVVRSRYCAPTSALSLGAP